MVQVLSMSVDVLILQKGLATVPATLPTKKATVRTASRTPMETVCMTSSVALASARQALLIMVKCMDY
jgi:hypothetical protein